MRKGKENDEYDDNEYTLYLVHEGGQPETMSKQSSEIGTYTVRYSFFLARLHCEARCTAARPITVGNC